MDKIQFTKEKLNELANKVELLLDEMTVTEGSKQALSRGMISKESLPKNQEQQIEQVTGEPAATFLNRFKQATRKDLCEEGGQLYSLWQKYGDLTKDEVLRVYGSVLASLGYSGSVLEILAVILTALTLHLGIRVFCMGA